MADRAVQAVAADNLTVVGATLAAPGPVRDGSVVQYAPALGWRDGDARAALVSLGLPVLARAGAPASPREDR
ncbi:hypothetical protein Ait01nite_081630 [Actinoplanes italicus]|uniref:Uncharacterized protein n=1 Tax=Actinoplanes italicus TaxID=113567 RepID=A0A2T0K386_9ACTN|nr:hypothetical protein [Actinoplanes italicus]PRX17323.1 hypothetical protein CLV67_11699 [Actinoplanes italicus]GIE35118.1 hypothetical protein Ait01nite_081630 [Actinoplanes italicus]